jgi:hypothetical protein
MKERILTNWTFIRALYLLMGILLMVQSALSQQWFGIAVGGYFAAMGLFAFGCASGNCFSGNCETKTSEPPITLNQNIEFEEVKTK